jgi:hypothetical protein
MPECLIGDENRCTTQSSRKTTLRSLNAAIGILGVNAVSLIAKWYPFCKGLNTVIYWYYEYPKITKVKPFSERA